MAENDFQGIIVTSLLIERQVEESHRWYYEWRVLMNVGIAALLLVDAMWIPGFDVLTLFGILVLYLSGSQLVRAEYRGWSFLMHLNEVLDERSRFLALRWKRF
jgi:hypothetical protein